MGSKNIYIPICFYYFEDVIENSMCDEEFTFQYVSIISCIAWILRLLLLYLHSNMFLLFLIQCVRLSTAPVIYIPICFYYFKQIVASLLKESKIYIPICFYYFDISNGICCSVFLIDIPICFYYFTEQTLKHFCLR